MDTNKKRICIVVPGHWEALKGGAEYQAKLITEYLVSTGKYEIFYLARHINKSFKPKGYKVIHVVEPRGLRRFGLFLDMFDLMRIFKEISPDFIYQRVGCGYTGIAAFYAKKYKKRFVWHVAHDREVMPFVRTLTRNIVFRYLDKIFQVYGVKNTSAIVTQTQQQADLLGKYYRLENDAVIPNAHPEPQEELLKSAPVKVVWVANVKPWKRPEIFLQLAKDLEDFGGTEFTMIGKLTGKPDWNEQIRKNSSRLRNLHFLGGQPQVVVNEILSKSHIFVNTSVQEGFPNTFIQAWFRRVPVLSLSVNPDGIFNDRRIGICSESYAELKGNLVTLINDKNLRVEMGNRAQEYAKRMYSLKNFSLLEKIITG